MRRTRISDRAAHAADLNRKARELGAGRRGQSRRIGGPSRAGRRRRGRRRRCVAHEAPSQSTFSTPPLRVGFLRGQSTDHAMVYGPSHKEVCYWANEGYMNAGEEP